MVEEMFAKRLGILHEETGMSQDDIVTHMLAETGEKIHQTSYSFYLRGTKKPTYPAVAAICRYFGVSFEWLTGQVEDRRTVKDLLRNLEEMGDSPEIRKTAKLLASLPDAQREAITANINAAVKEQEDRKLNNERWQHLSKLVAKVDTDGSLNAFVDAEARRVSGDVSSKEPVSELGN